MSLIMRGDEQFCISHLLKNSLAFAPLLNFLDPVYVIVEYLGKGDLKKVLIESRDIDTGTGYSNIPGLSKSLSRTLIKFARDVANGMAFLSSQKVNPAFEMQVRSFSLVCIG